MDLYWEWREWGGKYWLELSDDEQRRWRHVADLFDRQYQQGYDDGYNEKLYAR